MELAPELVGRLLRGLAADAEDLHAHRPVVVDGLGPGEAAQLLAHHADLARQHLDARISAGATGLARCADGVAGFDSGVRSADDRLAERLDLLARSLR